MEQVSYDIDWGAFALIEFIGSKHTQIGKEYKTALDIGSGTGVYTAKLSQNNKASQSLVVWAGRTCWIGFGFIFIFGKLYVIALQRRAWLWVFLGTVIASFTKVHLTGECHVCCR